MSPNQILLTLQVGYIDVVQCCPAGSLWSYSKPKSSAPSQHITTCAPSLLPRLRVQNSPLLSRIALSSCRAAHELMHKLAEFLVARHLGMHCATVPCRQD